MSNRRSEKRKLAENRRSRVNQAEKHGETRGVPEPDIPTSKPWVRRILPLGVFVITFIAFLPALRGEFLNWDDNVNFTENLSWRGLGWTQISWMFTTFHLGHYQPLTWLTLGLDYELWGHDAQGNLTPRGYHFTNDCFHAVNALLVYFLALKLLTVAHRGQRLVTPRQNPGMWMAAAFAALLWSVHPLRTESVAWLTERRDLVSGTLILLTTLAYLRYVAAAPGRRAGWYVLVLTLFILSLMGKVIGVTLPLVLLVLDCYPLRRFNRNGATGAAMPLKAKPWSLILEKIPLLVIALVFGSIVAYFDHERGWLLPLAEHPLNARIAQSLYGVVFYLWKSFIPFNLVPLYEIDRGMNPIQGRYVVYTLIVAVAGVVLLGLRKRFPALLSAALAYGILLGPTLGLVQTGPQMVADRYSYLSCIGWSIVAGGALGWLMLSKPATRLIVAAAAVCCISVLAAAAWQQSRIWKDSFTLWEYACARKNVDSTLSWSKYGLVLRDRNDLVGAEVALKRAIEIRPTLVKAHGYLGSVHMMMGRLDDADNDFRTAMTLDPRSFEAAFNHAYVLMQQNRLSESAEAFLEALKRTPSDRHQVNQQLADAHGNLGIILWRLNRRSEAAEHINMAKTLNPSKAQSLDDWIRNIP